MIDRASAPDRSPIGSSIPSAPAEPRRTRPWLWVLAAVLGALVLLVVGVGVAVFVAAGNDFERVEEAERHYNASFDAEQKVVEAIDGATDKHGELLPTAARQVAIAREQLAEARRESAASQASIGRLAEDEAGREEYLAMLATHGLLLDALEQEVAALASVAPKAQNVREARTAEASASERLSAAVSAGNRGKYGDALTEAQKASKEYGRAVALWAEIFSVDRHPDTEKEVQTDGLSRQEADLLAAAYKAAMAGEVDTFSRLLLAADDTAVRNEKIGDIPAFVDRLESLDAKIDELGKRVDREHDKAYDLLP